MIGLYCKRVEQHNQERIALGYLKVCGFHPIVLQILAGSYEKHQVEDLLTRNGPPLQPTEPPENGYSEQQLHDMLSYIPAQYCPTGEDDCLFHNGWKDIKSTEAQVLLRDALMDLQELRQAIDWVLKLAGQRNIGMGLSNASVDWKRGLQQSEAVVLDAKKAAIEKLQPL